MIKLIVFGTSALLKDIENIHNESLLLAITDILNINRLAIEKLFKPDGKSTFDKIQSIKNYTSISDEDMLLIDERKQYNLIRHLYRDIYPNSTQCEMLEFLSKNYILGVVSNSRRETVIRILNLIGITNYFSQIISNEDARHKPAPDMHMKIAAAFGVLPHEVLSIENSTAGRSAAIAAGVHIMPISNINDVSLRSIRETIHTIESNI